MNLNYTIIIQWSEEDECFVVTLPEFKEVTQPVTHGDTYEEAAKNAQEMLEILINIYQEDQKELPKPFNYGQQFLVA